MIIQRQLRARTGDGPRGYLTGRKDKYLPSLPVAGTPLMLKKELLGDPGIRALLKEAPVVESQPIRSGR